MVAITSNLRSTKSITDFVNLTDESATIALRLKAITAELALLTPDVLEQIGEGRAVKIGSQVRTLRPGTIEKTSRTCDDETAVEYCKSHGLKFQERSAEYVAPASFTSYVKKGLMSPELYEKTETAIVVVV